MKSNQQRNSQIAAVFFNGGMTFALCGLSYWLITHLLAQVFSVSQADDTWRHVGSGSDGLCLS